MPPKKIPLVSPDQKDWDDIHDDPQQNRLTVLRLKSMRGFGEMLVTGALKPVLTDLVRRELSKLSGTVRSSIEDILLVDSSDGLTEIMSNIDIFVRMNQYKVQQPRRAHPFSCKLRLIRSAYTVLHPGCWRERP